MIARRCRTAALFFGALTSAACGGARVGQRPAHGPVAGAAPSPAPFAGVQVDTLPWGEANMHPTLQWFRKRLVNDTTAKGIYVSLLRYPAGVINPSHVHPHPHGFYVLQGQLVTSRGTFGPGAFVWFPAGEVITHGAGPTEDMIALFVSGAPFKIDYISK